MVSERAVHSVHDALANEIGVVKTSDPIGVTEDSPSGGTG